MKHSFKLAAIFVGLFLALCSFSFADGIDPKIIIGDPDSGTPIGSDSFSFSLPNDPSGFFTGTLSFQNQTGGTWYSLYLTETTVPFNDVQCQANAFFNFCQVVPTNPNNVFASTTIEFLNTLPNPGTGIPNFGFFTLDFEPGTDGGLWPAGTNFDGQANATAVPEPSSKLLLVAEFLMLMGICGPLMRRKLRKSAIA